MFKKGQLVRSIRHGWVLVVAQDEITGRAVNLVSPVRAVPFKLRATSIELIGNNYQAKPKCSR